MTKFSYPLGTADFPKIREQGKVYVDKTDMMHSLANDFDYVFLARPRRFGKSLLCSTFKAYFEGRKELFEGLKVMGLEKEWKKYPVLHFTLSGLKDCTIAEAKSKLGGFLRDYEETYGRKDGDDSPGARFRSLIHNAAKKTGERVVVILDEYDAPIIRLMYEKKQLAAMRSMLREFYQVLKDEDAYIRFVFITGVTKFSQLSIFSELNNLYQISFEDEYSGICGITQEELEGALHPCVEELANKLKASTEGAYSSLKKNYDGYHFSPNGKDVYAPFSLLRALSSKTLSSFWFETSTPSALLEHLEHFKSVANTFDYDGIAVKESDFSSPCENAATPIPLLYQSGYLTIESYDPRLNRYTLKIPNNEVRNGLIDSLMPIILKRSAIENGNTEAEMADALLNGDLSKALGALRSYIAKIPYDIITKEEWNDKEKREAFYKLLIYLTFSMLNATVNVEVEVKSVLGRADVVIKTPDDIFIIELKVDKTVCEALEQIDDKGYAVQYESDHRRVLKCGVNISSEQRNLAHWIITDTHGNVIVEEDFTK